MSKEEIEKLFIKLVDEHSRAGFTRIYPSKDWQKAFDFYNYGHPDERDLHQGCRPCYRKVLWYMKSFINESEPAE